MTEREKMILQLLVEECALSGFEVTEHKGHQFARITWPNGEAVEMTDIDLTRFAGQIERGMERRGL